MFTIALLELVVAFSSFLPIYGSAGSITYKEDATVDRIESFCYNLI